MIVPLDQRTRSFIHIPHKHPGKERERVRGERMRLENPEEGQRGNDESPGNLLKRWHPLRAVKDTVKKALPGTTRVDGEPGEEAPHAGLHRQKTLEEILVEAYEEAPEGSPEHKLLSHGPLYKLVNGWKNKNRGVAQMQTVNRYSHTIADVTNEGHPFGKLRLMDVTLEDIPDRAKRSPYVLFTLDGQAAHTPRAASKGPDYSWKEWSSEMNILDIFGDLHVYIFFAKVGSEVIAMKDDRIGKVILPLANILSQCERPWVKKLLSGSLVYQTEVRIHILPLRARAPIYSRCVEGLPSSGMSRPIGKTGYIRFTIEVELNDFILKAMLTTPPLRPISSFPNESEQLSPQLMHRRKMRVAQAISLFQNSFNTLTNGILSWERPIATCSWLIIYQEITLFAQFYHLPFYICLCIVLGSIFISTSQSSTETSSPPPIIFSDETTLDPEIPQTLPDKIRTLQKLALSIQKLLGIVATIIERLYYSLSWDDPFISAILSAFLLIFGSLTSLVLKVLYEYAYVARLVLFLAGVSLHIPTSLQIALRQKLTINFREYIGFLRDRNSSSSSGEEAPMEEVLNALNDSEDPCEISNTPYEIEPEDRKKTINNVLRNILARIPDSLEIDHRRIARAQANPTV